MISVAQNNIAPILLPFLEQSGYERYFILCDSLVYSLHRELLAPLFEAVYSFDIMLMKGGEDCKTIESAQDIWLFLHERQANRHSVLIIIGGGSLSDLGSFAASVFHRGMDTVLISTTLLGMVDASVGGKTAIDFAGVKNLIGSFHLPKAIVADTSFLSSLAVSQVLSGFAELVKHALLMGVEEWERILDFDLFDADADWGSLIERHIAFKQSVVDADPFDRGVRAQLNLGHTIAHALEAFSHTARQQALRPALYHGEAVMIGLICEVYFSYILLGFPVEILESLLLFTKYNYKYYPLSQEDYPEIIALAQSDKKNQDGEIKVLMLSEPGATPELRTVNAAMLSNSFDFYCNMMGD